jgi:hypothetical protein
MLLHPLSSILESSWPAYPMTRRLLPVAFYLSFDAIKPNDWPSGRKQAMNDVLSAIGFNRIMVSAMAR